MIIVEEKRLKMSFEEKRDWISYGKWMISLTPLDVTQHRYFFKETFISFSCVTYLMETGSNLLSFSDRLSYL